ncbi:hypothetical protein ACIQ6K_35675 [Streptomyces sp. NPDC096354]|uniref:hypothetical protein n=1 Tax=Streptomyces sp. NPDC096354 TaxID=3366088 RepID=UPI003807B108
MRIVVLGASALIGHGALRACLLDDTVTEVLAVVRSPLRTPNCGRSSTPTTPPSRSS